MNQLEICKLVAEYYGFTSDDIFAESRKGKLPDARHVLMYILKTDFNLTDDAISSFLRKARGTVYKGVKKISDLKGFDSDIYLDIINIRTFMKYPDAFQKKKYKTKTKVSKKIYQYDLEMNEIGVYDDIKSASEKTGISVSTISRSLKEYKKLGRDCYWKKK